jgi:hypothetical protein
MVTGTTTAAEHEDNGIGGANCDCYGSTLGTVWRYRMDRPDGLRRSFYLSGVKSLLLSMLVNTGLGCESSLFEAMYI